VGRYPGVGAPNWIGCAGSASGRPDRQIRRGGGLECGVVPILSCQCGKAFGSTELTLALPFTTGVMVI